ncbi:MAG TPA: hypothetical protein VN903_19595 [Polyangia bacterium]|jgi:hypothetical protein|nr:hypothetical protein [Polyangia bacterium]
MTTFGATIPSQLRARAPQSRDADLVGRAGARAAVRLLIWLALWATVLRNIGASVGTWAAGSLGVCVTFLVAVVIPMWLFVVFPSWLAFRFAAPRGMRRLALAACWMSPLVRLRDLPSIAAFLDVVADRPGTLSGFPTQLPVDAWTALAAALQADRRRSFALAARIVDALAHLPTGARFPWLARVHGVEALVISAFERRDWPATTRYARLGQGRLIALLALVARATRGEEAPPSSLWTRWLAAPLRRTTLPLVRALAWRGRTAPASADPAAPPHATVHARHVAMLEAAARHEEIRSEDVMALAAAWQPAIDDAALAATHARALGLGVRDGAARAQALREQVLDELALLLVRAQGEQPRAPAHPFAETLARRARETEVARIKALLAAFDADRVGPSLHPLAAWERWLALRAAWERAEQSVGRAALATLWRTGVRDRLWGYCCAVSHVHGAHAAWAAHAMFDWLADRAEYVGDMVAVLANRENARIAQSLAR